jgi:glycosyltransferase involved in cell wall biosynthesis
VCEQLRILFIQHAGGLGGSAISLLNLAADLQAKGHTAIIALARPSESLIRLYESRQIQTVTAPEIACLDHSTVANRRLNRVGTYLDYFRISGKWRLSQRKTLRLVDDLAPDIVHLNSMPLSSSAIALARKSFPFVWHVREPPPDQGLRTSILRRILAKCRNLIFLSQFDAAAWMGELVSTSDVAIVPNAVPDSWFDERSPNLNDATASRSVPVIAYFGGFVAEKGDSFLLNALEILNRHNKHWQLHAYNTVFEFKERAAPSSWAGIYLHLGLKTRFDRIRSRFLALGNKVVLKPFATSVPDALQKSDLVVFPAVVPHFPRPVIEAAALGLPAVASRLGGIDECVVDGETGLLCRVGDAVDLAENLDELLRHPTLRVQLGRRAQARARDLYRQSNQTALIESIYRKCDAGSLPEAQVPAHADQI